jgi:hypothetical protein
MISRTVGAAECFVYITLPGKTEAVTAGRYVHDITRQGVSTGRFVYGRSYLARPDAVELDPVALKLGTRTHETVLMKGLFGALRDSGPDYWGRRVIERHAGLVQLGELDYLLHSPDDRAGALGRWANASNLISQAQRFLLAPAAARRIIDDMEAVVRSRWYDIARTAGVSNSDCTAIAGAFAYPGFRA